MYCVDSSKFSKIVLAHILGGVGNLCAFMLHVYSRTRLPNVYEIGSYLTDTKHKTILHVFETLCTLVVHKTYRMASWIYGQLKCVTTVADEGSSSNL